MKLLVVVLVLLTTACGFKVNTLSAGRDSIALKTSAGDPGPVARSHCAQYGRTSRLQGTDPSNATIYYFACVE